MSHESVDTVTRFRDAVAALDGLFVGDHLSDENVEAELHKWLDGNAPPLDWSSRDRVTPDEWFFITTLYGELTLDGQRTHIRKYFPSLFVGAAHRDIRNFVPGMPQYAGLRSGWMASRLSKMADVLRQRGQSMGEYVEDSRRLESSATPADPMPALDAIIRDHNATGWKTLSVFIRDCVRGNCFPIDTRVQKVLDKHRLPGDERQLVSLALAIGRNPRQIARMFYQAGGWRTTRSK